MNLSSIIMELEQIAWRWEHVLQRPEVTAVELERQAEELFRCAAKIRKDGTHGR